MRHLLWRINLAMFGASPEPKYRLGKPLKKKSLVWENLPFFLHLLHLPKLDKKLSVIIYFKT